MLRRKGREEQDFDIKYIWLYIIYKTHSVTGSNLMLINPFIFMKWERWYSLKQKDCEHHFVFRMHLIYGIIYMPWSPIKVKTWKTQRQNYSFLVRKNQITTLLLLLSTFCKEKYCLRWTDEEYLKLSMVTYIEKSMQFSAWLKVVDHCLFLGYILNFT